MACDYGFDVFSKIVVDDGCGIFGQQGDAFGDSTANWRRRVKHCYWVLVPLNHDFGASTHTGQESSKIVCRLCFSYMDYVLSHPPNYRIPVLASPASK